MFDNLDESVREEMGGEMGSQGERDSRFRSPGEKLGSRGEKRGSYGEKRGGNGEKRGSCGEKRGDRCLVINSHWASATKAAPMMEQVNNEHCVSFLFHLCLHRPLILTPRIRDSYCSCCCSVTEKPGLTHYPMSNTLSNG